MIHVFAEVLYILFLVVLITILNVMFDLSASLKIINMIFQENIKLCVSNGCFYKETICRQNGSTRNRSRLNGK